MRHHARSDRTQITAPRKSHIVTYNVYGTEDSLETGRAPGYDTVGHRYFATSDKRIVSMNCNGTRLDAPLQAKLASTHGTADYYAAEEFLDTIEFDREPLLNADRAMEKMLPGLVPMKPLSRAVCGWVFPRSDKSTPVP